MHICYLTHEYPKPGLNPGGVGVFLQNLAPRLVAAGHKVTVLGVNNEEKTEDGYVNGVRVIRFAKPNSKGLNWWFIKEKLNKYLGKVHHQSPIDIVEGAELALAFIKKVKGIHYVIRLHGGHYFFSEAENRSINSWKGFQERKSFRKADAIIAVSEYVLNHTKKYHEFGQLKQAIIRYPIDTVKFSPKEKAEVQPDSMIFVGTICEKKGVRNLVDALELLKKEGLELSLDIYGKDWFFPDGRSYTAYIREEIKIKKLDSQINVFPPVPHEEIPSLYASHEVCIFPSFMETQGLVAPEAMAMEKVVIFTDKGPGPETITHQVNGYLCDPLKPESIASSIRLAFGEKQSHAKIGKSARGKVLDMFEPGKVLKENIKFYQDLING